MQQTLLAGDPAYDAALGLWMKCPRCGSLDIDHGIEVTYQACFRCGIFLNKDGHTNKMIYRGRPPERAADQFSRGRP